MNMLTGIRLKINHEHKNVPYKIFGIRPYDFLIFYCVT